MPVHRSARLQSWLGLEPRVEPATLIEVALAGHLLALQDALAPRVHAVGALLGQDKKEGAELKTALSAARARASLAR